jgi:hypothetical protein
MITSRLTGKEEVALSLHPQRIGNYHFTSRSRLLYLSLAYRVLGGKYIFRQMIKSAMVKSTKFRADRVISTINADVM